MDSPTTSGFSWPQWLRIAGAYFLHFSSLGFASFPLQTHLRKVHSPALGSLIASVFPIAAILTYFFFRYAERRGWTKSPGLLLLCVASAVVLMQSALGLQLEFAASERPWIPPLLGTTICILLLGCSQSSCMTILNHFGVSIMGPHAYSVRAAGSAGYMLAIVLMGALIPRFEAIGQYHLFLGSSCALLHTCFIAWNLRSLRHFTSYPATSKPAVANHLETTDNAPLRNRRSIEKFLWAGLIALVWLVAFCEMSYGLYSHEFLTTNYQAYGYYLFAAGILFEILLLLILPHFPQIRKRLLFLGPLGWLLLFGSCFLVEYGWWMFGAFNFALALNCPFQISANETSHTLHSNMLGVATMMLAQSLGYITATLTAAAIHYGKLSAPHQNLWNIQWTLAIVMACIGIPLAIAVRAFARRLEQR